MASEFTKRLFVAFVFSACIAGLIFAYSSLRLGSFSLFTLNKSFADTATVLLCFVLLAGPLSRNLSNFGYFMMHRKVFGMILFFYAYIHAIISIFFLPEIFPITRFTVRNIPFLFGLSGIIMLYVLFAYSFQFFIQTIKSKYWWILQSWGVRMTIVFVLLHFSVMKWREWFDWLLTNGGESSRFPIPPASFVIGLFCIFVLAVRIFDRMGKAVARIAINIAFLLYLIFIIGAIYWRTIQQL